MADIAEDTVREQLVAERDELTRQLAELRIDGTSGEEFDENFADSGQVAAELGEHLSLAATLQDQLDEVQGALGRLDAGTYGRCTVCGEEISAARLEAMPAASNCIAHA